ncbi:MAG TPA: hypothetical protein VK476_07625, partial [Flavobacterium sp.]|nr:hypothetical protein [Flavobacterium sp.]
MKSLQFILGSLMIMLFFSCDSNDDSPSDQVLFAVPVVKSFAEIRNDISVWSARTTNSDGKIYVSEKQLYYIAQEEGVHVYDNSNPAAPLNTAFINIGGVHDIAVKGDFLYADNYMDLLVFNISDLQHITLVRTVENAITFYATFPETAQYYDYTVTAGTGEMITGFKLEYRERPNEQNV